MRVVHISKVTGIAGSEGHLLSLLPGLVDQGVEVCMIVLEDPRYPVDRFCNLLAARGIDVRRVPINHHLDVAVIGRIRRILDEFKPDIVHTHLLHADLYGLLAAQGKAVSSRHNDDKFRGNIAFKLINQAIMRRADRVIAISGALAQFIERIEGLPANKIVTIRYGLEAPEPRSDEAARRELGYHDEQVVGFFGRLIEQKGVDVLLDAFAEVHLSHPKARLLIVGDGKDRGSLEAQAHQLGLREVVHFAGWLDGARRLMQACDVITVPSRWEGFGLVTLEAMACAKPLIVSNISALPEIVVDGVTGLLTPPRDAAALAAAVQHLLAHPDLAEQMGRAGYQRLIEHFSVDKMVYATLDLYRELNQSGMSK